MEGGNYFLQLAFVSSVDQVVETISKLAFVSSPEALLTLSLASMGNFKLVRNHTNLV